MREVAKQTTTTMTTTSIQKPIATPCLPTVSHYHEGLDELYVHASHIYIYC